MVKFVLCIIALMLYFSNLCNPPVIAKEPSDLQKDSSAMEKVLTPVGWMIGGAIAPVYLGVEYGEKAINWTGENVICPIGNSLVNTSEYILDATGSALTWSAENILFPIGEGIGYATTKTVEYTIIPALDGGVWVICKTIDGAVYISKHASIPVYKYILVPTYKGAKFGCEYILLPIGKGTYYSGEFIVRNIGKGLDFGIDHILQPVERG